MDYIPCKLDRMNCPMRAENGNCLPVGGFCTAVADIYCEIAHKAYDKGWFNCTQKIVRCNECVYKKTCIHHMSKTNEHKNGYCAWGKTKDGEQ